MGNRKIFNKNRLNNFLLVNVITLFISILLAVAVQAAPGSVESGMRVYKENCYKCHGYSGDGLGPLIVMHLPLRPRNFNLGVFKLKTSPPSYEIARDEDIFNAVTNGLRGGGMPSFKDVLTEQERWDVVAYIKGISDVFEGKDNPPSLDYSGKVPYSQESVARGEEAFENFQCGMCHGEAGEIAFSEHNEIMDKHGRRTWPRNLKKPWTFNSPYTREALYSRVTNGIPGTPMPSFADEDEQGRWDVVNYIMWLAEEDARKKNNRKIVGESSFAFLAFAFFLLKRKGGSSDPLLRNDKK